MSSELKTKATQASVAEFLATVDAQRQADCQTLLALMQRVTGCAPQMWGENMVGFGTYHYRYASGRTGDWPLVAFSPRKTNLTVYIMAGFEQYEALLAQLGKHSTGKACLYLKKLADVDMQVLETLVRESVEHMRRTNPT